MPLNNQLYPSFNLSVNYFGNSNPPIFTEKPDGTLNFENNDKKWIANLRKTDFSPSGSMRIQLPFANKDEVNSLFQSASNNQFYFLSSIQVPLEVPKVVLPSKIAVVWDNSFSTSERDFLKEWTLLSSYIALLPNNSTIDLYFLNNEFKEGGTFTNNTASIEKLRQKLANTIYDGATDYSTLQSIPQAQAVLLFSDGISSFGDLNPNIKNKYYSITSLAKSDFDALKYLSETNGGRLINLNAINNTIALELLTSTPIQFLGLKNQNNVREIVPNQGLMVNNKINLAGILSTNQGSFTALFGYDGKTIKEVEVQLDAQPDIILSGFNIAQIWAHKKIQGLEINHFENHKQIAHLSKEFGVVNRNNSLIVLEDIYDYVKFEITPPEELLAEYNRLITNKKKEYANSKKTILNKIAQKTHELKVWHSTDFSTAIIEDSKSPQVKLQSATATESSRNEEGDEREYYDEGYEGEYSAKRGKIILSEISSNADYMPEFNKLNSASDIYDLYLKKRPQYKYSSKFYFDVSKLLYSKDKNLSMKVLSTLADLDLENEELFKTLHYVLQERGEKQKDLWITQKLLEWRPFDPQSHRDYALALLDNNEAQRALDVYRDLIYQDFTEELSVRDEGIEETLIMEINNIISKYPQVNKEKVNKAFIADLPVDIRVVLNWNKDHTDIDLWLTDPNQEECYYGHRYTKMGGRLSNDFTDGFGPEQFLLKKAQKGTYIIKANFFAERQLSLDQPTAIMAEVYLNYGSGENKNEKLLSSKMIIQMLTLQMIMTEKR